MKRTLLTRSEVQRIIDTADEMSSSELSNAANRLYDLQLALRIQNPVNANAFGASSMLVHMNASMVLRWMEDEDLGPNSSSEASNSPIFSAEPKSGCAPLLVVSFFYCIVEWLT